MKRGVSGRNINQSRQRSLVTGLVETVRRAFQSGETGSLWGLEGPLRAALRSNLCRQSWKWSDADAATRVLLEEVFSKAGAERPAWDEGQPEWIIKAGMLIERTRCANCHKPLPEGRPKFCSHLCANAQHKRIAQMKEAREEMTVRIAIGQT